MIVRELMIENFRGIAKADINFGEHSLLVGCNNVGKSTVFEALDLVLGPQRIKYADSIDEHDFYMDVYVEGDDKPVDVKIQVILGKLTDEEESEFWDHLEFWDEDEQEWRPASEVPKEEAGGGRYPFALRVEFRGSYLLDDDEFECRTYFLCPHKQTDELEPFRTSHKRKIGFVYLRSLRTGQRALSLERGTLLSILMDLYGEKRKSWESIIERLRELGPEISDDPAIKPVVQALVSKVAEYVPLCEEETKHLFHVTNLTREALRKSLSLFLASEISEVSQPFTSLGNGTANVLVFALLEAISEMKANVIFAMEEPETALPPYTQRRIVNSLKARVQQCLFTSHSPYVAENFIDKNLLVLHRDEEHTLFSSEVELPSTLKSKNFVREFRQKYAEGIVSRGVIVVEGISDVSPLYIASAKLEEAGRKVNSLDLLGVSIVIGDSHTAFPAIGDFFVNIDVYAFAFHDKVSDGASKEIEESFDYSLDHGYKGIEALLANQLSLGTLERFTQLGTSLSDWPQKIVKPTEGSEEENMRKYVRMVLRSRKGSGYTAILMQLCEPKEIPEPIVEFLEEVTAIMQNMDDE